MKTPFGFYFIAKLLVKADGFIIDLVGAWSWDKGAVIVFLRISKAVFRIAGFGKCCINLVKATQIIIGGLGLIY